ncbi:MAG: DUF4347 domain-containing protein, partial [Phycisphaeraceae bacterium]|nr:DUF4347 domain-containing protein [Phycisphaeraceae bacterium]
MGSSLIKNIWKWTTTHVHTDARACGKNPSDPQASFSLEPLESRLLLSADLPFSELSSPPPNIYDPPEVVCEAGLLDDVSDICQAVPASQNAALARATDADLFEAVSLTSTAPTTIPDELISQTDVAAAAGAGLEATSLTVAAPVTTPDELVIIDAGVQDYQKLLDDLASQADSSQQREVVLLDAGLDGISQISDILAGYSDLDAVHLISHGSDGVLSLGNARLDLGTLQNNSAQIEAWGSAFAETGDILLYGCDLAAGQDGQTLIASLSELTGADVAASDDKTGSALLGGDWDLEYIRGHIETVPAFSTALMGNWLGLLDTFTVTTTADSDAGSLRQAIIDAEAHAGLDTIEFNIGGGGVQTILVGTDSGVRLPTIGETVIIDGTSQPGYAGVPLIELDGTNVSAGTGLMLFDTTSDGSTVTGLVINRFPTSGIFISLSSGHTIQGNYIGTDTTGLIARPNLGDGIRSMFGETGGNQIGGSGANQGNVIAGNADHGIEFYYSNSGNED